MGFVKLVARLLLFSMIAGPAYGQEPVVTGPDPVPSEVARTHHFRFHSHELFNLHHFLYQCARTLARRDGARFRGRPVEVTEMARVEALQGEEREAWFAALEIYRSELAARDLLFDGTMYRLKNRLTSIEDVEGAWPEDLDPAVAEALRLALPVYRERFREDHEAANRAWIKSAVSLLERFEERLVEHVTRAYGGEWPPPPVRVDVCAYANWAGAYTTGGPAHVTLSSTDRDAQGYAALEVLVHEASHTPQMIAPLREALNAAYRDLGAEPPDDLWHLFLFVTSGDAVRRTLEAEGIGGYEHYGDRTGLYERGAWKTRTPLLAEPWLDFLDGEITREEALARIAEAIR